MQNGMVKRLCHFALYAQGCIMYIAALQHALRAASRETLPYSIRETIHIAQKESRKVYRFVENIKRGCIFFI